MDIIKIKPVFEDRRGTIWDFLTNEETSHIGFLTTVKGAVRGKHFHKLQQQYTLVLNGKIRVYVKDVRDSKSQVETFELNEMEMILFPTFFYHAIESIEDSKCLVFTSKGRHNGEYENDTFRVNDIESFIYKE